MSDVKSHSEPSMEEILASIRRIIAEDGDTPPPINPAPANPVPLRPAPEPLPPLQRPMPPQQAASPLPPLQPPPQPNPLPPAQDAILELTDRVDDDDVVRNIAGGNFGQGNFGAGNLGQANLGSGSFAPTNMSPGMSAGFGTRQSYQSAPQQPPQPPPAPPAGGRMTRPPPLKTGAMPGEPPKRIVSDAAAAASVATLVQLAGLGQRERQHELPLGDVGRTLEEMVRELLRPHLKEWLDANLPRLVERLVREEIHRLVREAQGN